MNTAADIKNAATALNAAYPGAAEQIAQGEAVLRVVSSTDASGWQFRFTICPSVLLPDGGMVYGAEPKVITWRALRGTEHIENAARRAARKAFPDVNAPISYLNRGC